MKRGVTDFAKRLVGVECELVAEPLSGGGKALCV